MAALTVLISLPVPLCVGEERMPVVGAFRGCLVRLHGLIVHKTRLKGRVLEHYAMQKDSESHPNHLSSE